jgi:hypothetical protein
MRSRFLIWWPESMATLSCGLYFPVHFTWINLLEDDKSLQALPEMASTDLIRDA